MSRPSGLWYIQSIHGRLPDTRRLGNRTYPRKPMHLYKYMLYPGVPTGKDAAP